MDRRRPRAVALLVGWGFWSGDGAVLAEPGPPAAGTTVGQAAAAATSTPAPSTTAPAAIPRAPVRVLLWLDVATDAAFAERVAGQTSDLPVALTALPRSALPASDPIAFTAAERVARETGAAVVAWCTRPAPGTDRLTLHLVDVDGHRRLSREVGDGSPRPDGDVSSATLEAAALVLREALRALLEGAQIGMPVVSTPVAAEPRAVIATAPERPARPVAARALAGQAAVGWATSLDGAVPLGHQGPELAVGVERGRAELDLSLTLPLPVRAADEFATIRLLRPSMALRGGLRIRASEGFAWEPGLRLGLVAYRRTTEPSGGGLDPTGARTVLSLLVGPESRVGLRLTGATEAWLAVGLELLPQVPEIGYQIAGEFTPALRPWQLQPRVALGVEARKSGGP